MVLFSALLLGLLAAVNPCQLAINLSALATFGVRTERSTRSMIVYLLGRLTVYLLICLSGVAFLNAGFHEWEWMQKISEWIEHLLPWCLIAGGVFFFFRFLHHHHHDGSCHHSSDIIHKPHSPFALGFLLAFLFCPETTVIIFGMMLPLAWSANAVMQWLVPIVFAIFAVIPLLIPVWLIHCGSIKLSGLVRQAEKLQVWTNLLLSILFLSTAVALFFL